MAKIIEKIYTVILLNYNNEKYIYDAIDSILIQDYPMIQLIITDDHSKNFNQQKIKNYVDKRKKENIKYFNFLINKYNQGTVKTINKALKKSIGDYILIFASDDKLADEHVLSNYASIFDTSKYRVVTSQWEECDQNLTPIKKNLNHYKEKVYNKKNVKAQLLRLCQSNIYGSGATSYKRDVFEIYGNIDEKYTYLEDWPYWIRLLAMNEKIYFGNFDGLLHRDGGISKSNSVISSTCIKFTEEILDTFMYEIIPLIDRFNVFSQVKILKSYDFHIRNYASIVDVATYESQLRNIIKKNKFLKIIWWFKKITPNLKEKIIILYKYNKAFLISIILSLLYCFLLANQFRLSSDLFLVVCILGYITIWYLSNIIYKVYNLKRGKMK